ncbi:BRCA1-associated RING domain protein 1 [Electrophorus electricus]|uniref:BRCA1-associated RING domain protein 1 n=1 Tax=Electrophorus electricus TaxID=8005 RepID=UPI0015CFC63D|nr:BRCA1-associated RING domain protein 1 [Electrophorus electricus]
MEPVTVAELTSGTWVKTREAVARFRKLLLCSKCSQILIEPVCLGICEHLLCRSCAGPHAGDGCSVCHSPAWVKDIQINRQLSNIAELFRSLESLFQHPELPAAVGNPSPGSSQNAVLTEKKNFKIWFSPRSRKVRCRVEKPAKAIVSTRKSPEVPLQLPPSSLLSVFNFNSSSQDSGSSPPPTEGAVHGRKKKRKRSAGPVGKASCGRFQNKEKLKKRLQAANQQWGFGSGAAMEHQAGEEEAGREHSGDTEMRTSKRVSFRYPASRPEEEPLDGLHEGDAQFLSPTRRILKKGMVKETEQSNEEQNALVSSRQSPRKQLPDPELLLDGLGPAQPSPRGSLKRARPEECAGSAPSTPRRPRPFACRRRRPIPSKAAAPSAPPPDGSGLSEVPEGPADEQRKGIPGSSLVGENHSPAIPAKGRWRAGQRHGHDSPAHTKRNRKGETPLHLAAIKGDVAETTQLLDQGADPNLKDHAGWTPLHEACNLGHLGVVKVLLQHGALLNTPGYENDSPLHDAVRNGHVEVVRRLLECGASPGVLNILGLRPIDCAGTEEMREILRMAPMTHSPISTPLSLPASMSKSAGILRKDAQVTLIGTKLTRAQQKQLSSAAQVLGGKHVQTFSSAVTHVVVPEGGVPSTLTALLAILGGCWVVRFSWLAGSLQQGTWLAEDVFEVGEGPRRARANRDNLLPRLFDGCFFYLLGSFRKPPRDELLQLVKAGGGQLLARQPKPDSDVTQTVSTAAYHARPGSDQALCTQYVLYDAQGGYRPGRVRLGKVWSAPSSWLLDCTVAFSLLPVPEV